MTINQQFSLHHRNPECRYLASTSKDCSIRIWDTVLGRCDKILTGHTQSVTCVKWGGDGLLYTSSQDRTIKVWRAKDVRCVHSWWIKYKLKLSLLGCLTEWCVNICCGLCCRGFSVVHCKVTLTGSTRWPSAPTMFCAQERLSLLLQP